MEAAGKKTEEVASSLDTEAAAQGADGGHKGGGGGYIIAATAHAVDKDSWQQVGLLLVIGFNCAYVLSFSNLMMVPLGWGWGAACLLLVAAAAWYANWLLAGLHVVDGHRFIRYRDLMGFVFGRKMYYITWFLQFTTLLLGNIGFILLGGRALKAINAEFSDSPARLQWFIAATGAVYFAFAYFVPTISAMRNWLATSAALTIAYDVALLVILAKDGGSNKNKDFSVHGTRAEKVFNAFGAIAAILVCNTSGLLPEIQVHIDAAEAGGEQHEEGAGAAVQRRRGGILRDQRGRLLGVRRRRLRVPPEPARRAALGGRAHQRRRLPAERRLAAPVHGADPRGAGHAAAEAGGGHVLAVQPDAAASGEGDALRRQRVRHRALPLHGGLRQPLRLLRALPAHLHLPQHARPQDRREGRREMASGLALGHHRRLHGSERRHHRCRRSFDRPQRQDLPFLRGRVDSDPSRPERQNTRDARSIS